MERQDYPLTNTVVLRPTGPLSIGSVGELRRSLRGLAREDSRVVVIDLADAQVEDSAALHPLVELGRRARARGTRVVVAGADDDLASRLRVYGLVDRRSAPRPVLSAEPSTRRDTP